MHGADVDDPTRTIRGAQVIHEILSDKKGSAQIDLKDKIEILLGDIPEIGVFFDAGVVHENVDLTHLLDSFGDDAAIVLRIGKITLNHVHPATQRRNGIGGLLRALAKSSIIHNNVSSLLGKTDSDGLSDSLRAACDECDFSFEFHWGFLLVFCLEKKVN